MEDTLKVLDQRKQKLDNLGVALCGFKKQLEGVQFSSLTNDRIDCILYALQTVSDTFWNADAELMHEVTTLETTADYWIK